MNKLKAFWASLPHQLQAAIMFGGSAVLEAVVHAISEGKIPSTLPEFKHFIGSALATGVAAAYAFYRLPNGSAQLVAQAKAENAAKVPFPPQNFQQ